MKKIMLMAFVALSVSAFAQKVTPLNITLAEVKIDSLRALYMADPIMYKAALKSLDQALEKNEDEVKAAKAELKVEQQHAKEMAKSLKEATKMAASLKKLYAKEESELKSMSKVVEKQQKTLSKQKELNQETRDVYRAFLEKQQKELGYSLREVADRSHSVSDLETAISTRQTELSAFDQQVTQKGGQLGLIEAQLKERQKIVDAEQKAAKSLQ